jgi:large subunit ribosomal protein L9
MEIILLQDVEKVGQKGEVANVSDGYARNYLFPRKLAETATPGRIAQVRKIMEQKEAHARREAEQADEVRDLLSKTVLTIAAPVGSADRLFGSVTTQDIATAIFEARKIRVDKRNVDLEEPIKTVGTYMVKVNVHNSVEPAEVKVIVVPEERGAVTRMAAGNGGVGGEVGGE